MSYSSDKARRQLLDELGEAVDQLAVALASLGEAYEEVDESTGDSLEEDMFRPIRTAYGRARRTHSEFAARHGIPERSFGLGSSGVHSSDPRVYVQRAIDAAERADHVIGEMQDSMLPVEVGDQDLRAGLTETRALISAVPGRGRQLLRTLGR